MARFKVVALVVVLLLGVTFLFLVLRRPPAEARWLRLEVPPRAVLGETFPVTVVLYVPKPGSTLSVELHGYDINGTAVGVPVSVPPQPSAAIERSYVFALPVPVLDGLTSIRIVTFLSPDSTWVKRTRACLSAPILVAAPPTAVSAERVRVRLLEGAPGAESKHTDSVVARWSTAVILFMGTLICAVRARTDKAQRASPPSASRAVWRRLALLCVAAAMWEALNAEATLGEFLRDFALAHSLYAKRRLLQWLITIVVIMGTLVFSMAALRRSRGHPESVSLAGLDLYLGISMLNFVSLHEVDTLLSLPVFGVALVQLAKLAAAATAVSGAVRHPRAQ